MARQSFVQIRVDGKWVLVDKAERYKYETDVDAPMVMPDIEAFQSPVDGAVINSRSAKRAHMKRHNLIEVGNEQLNRSGRRSYDESGLSKTIKKDLIKQFYK